MGALTPSQFLKSAEALGRRLARSPHFPGINASSPIVRQLTQVHELDVGTLRELRDALNNLRSGHNGHNGGVIGCIDRIVRALPQDEVKATGFAALLRDAVPEAATTGSARLFTPSPLSQYETGLNARVRALWRARFRPHYVEALKAAENIHSFEDLAHAIDRYANAMGKVNNPFYNATIDANSNVSDVKKQITKKTLSQIANGPADAINNRIIGLLRESLFLKDVPPEYQPWFSRFKNMQRVYHPDNQGEQKELTKLGIEYTETFAKVRIPYGGDDKTIGYFEILSLLGSNLPPAKREAIAIALYAKLAEVRPQIVSIYGKMVPLRDRIAKRSGGDEKFATYNDYAYTKREYTYGKNNLKAAIAAFKPRLKSLIQWAMAYQAINRLGLSGVDQLNPWDVDISMLASHEKSTPILPFKGLSEAQIIDKAQKVYTAMHPEMGRIFATIAKNGRFDLLARKTKDPNRIFVAWFHLVDNLSPTEGLPFLAISIDPETAPATSPIGGLMHETGHTIQGKKIMDACATPGQHVISDITQPDLAELTALIIEELTIAGHLDEFFDDPDQITETQKLLRVGNIFNLGWTAATSEFEDWVYENPEKTDQERSDKYYDILLEYGLMLPHWPKEIASYKFMATQHLFNHPAYFQAYFLARIAAMQVGLEYQVLIEADKRDGTKNAQAFIEERFLKPMALGGSITLPEYWKELRARYDFGDEATDAFFAIVKTELDRLQIG